MQFPRPIYAQADLAKTPLAKVLESNGFDASKPALFTCEGLLCYLPQVQLHKPCRACCLRCLVRGARRRFQHTTALQCLCGLRLRCIMGIPPQNFPCLVDRMVL